MKKLLTISLLTLIISCGKFKGDRLIEKFKAKESYRIWTTEKSLTKEDSIYLKRKSFKSYDSKNRLINESNYKFYFYDDKKNRISKTKTIYRREGKGNAIIHTQNYLYNKNGLLAYITEKREKIDTIKAFVYDPKENLIKTKTDFKTVIQKFENGHLKKRIVKERNTKPKISEFRYDSLNRLIVENWVFGGNHRMKTKFEYDEEGKLIKEIDSSLNQGTNPNEFVEFMSIYKYNKNDSIVEIIDLGRVLSESDFKVRGKKLFERRKE